MSSKMVKHDAVLAGINPADLEKEIPESKFRPYIIGAIAVLLLILTVSWVFSDFLQNRIESEPVQNDVLDFGSVRVVFDNNTLAVLRNEFVQNQHREIKACLFGSIDDKTYRVEQIVFPEVIRANVAHIVSVPCSEGIIIDAHSHPVDECLASDQDISVLRRLQSQNQAVRMLVMCSQDRFAII